MKIEESIGIKEIKGYSDTRSRIDMFKLIYLKTPEKFLVPNFYGVDPISLIACAICPNKEGTITSDNPRKVYRKTDFLNTRGEIFSFVFDANRQYEIIVENQIASKPLMIERERKIQNEDLQNRLNWMIRVTAYIWFDHFTEGRLYNEAQKRILLEQVLIENHQNETEILSDLEISQRILKLKINETTQM